MRAGDSVISPPSLDVIMVLEASVPLNVMNGLSAGTTIFSLINPCKIDYKKKIQTNFYVHRQYKRIVHLNDN